MPTCCSGCSDRSRIADNTSLIWQFYQITQYDKPSTINGYVDFEFNSGISRVRITRAHLEEDVGKNFHFDRNSGVDFNRAGVPLMEIEIGRAHV